MLFKRKFEGLKVPVVLKTPVSLAVTMAGLLIWGGYHVFAQPIEGNLQEGKPLLVPAFPSMVLVEKQPRFELFLQEEKKTISATQATPQRETSPNQDTETDNSPNIVMKLYLIAIILGGVLGWQKLRHASGGWWYFVVASILVLVVVDLCTTKAFYDALGSYGTFGALLVAWVTLTSQARITLTGSLVQEMLSDDQKMQKSIDFFLKEGADLRNPDGTVNEAWRRVLQKKPEVSEHYYRIMTVLRHVERMYSQEKLHKEHLQSLITPDIVEVVLHTLALLYPYQATDKPVYNMVYEAFDIIRNSYIEPIIEAYEKKQTLPEGYEAKTRRVLLALKKWDIEFGDDLSCIVTESQLLIVNGPDLAQLNELITRYEAITKPKLMPKTFIHLG
jgi:hypothetical protein